MIAGKTTNVSRPQWAVVDIGSNSVRFVVYDGPSQAPITVLNEKVLCGLGQRVPETGALRPEAMASALSVLGRFKVMIDSINPKRLAVFATAACRDAPNGEAFLQDIVKLGLPVQLISGTEEARLAALGILSGAPNILLDEGGALAGDIGGGSLELCHIAESYDGSIGPKVSLPLGGLHLYSTYGLDKSTLKKVICGALDEVSWLDDLRGKTTSFYAVGGAWRAMARLLMIDADYPLDIIDQYTLNRGHVRDLYSRLWSMPIEEIEALPGLQRRRAATMPIALLVLKTLMSKVGLENVVVSSSGVREGMIFDGLSEAEKVSDPLPQLAQYVAESGGNNLYPDVKAVLKFVDPLLPKAGTGRRRLWSAAVLLSQVALAYHPEMRAHQAATTTVGLPLRGLSHSERVMLALALYYRHGGRGSKVKHTLPLQIITDDQRQEARAFGLALRFALEFDPNARASLGRAALTIDKTTLSFHLPKADYPLWGRSPAKRLERLASALRLDLVTPDGLTY